MMNTNCLHTCRKEFSRMCDPDETQRAIDLHARLLRDPRQGLAEGYRLRADPGIHWSDTCYIELPGEGEEARVLSLVCEGWTAYSLEAPDKIKWNSLPLNGDITVYEFRSRRRLLH